MLTSLELVSATRRQLDPLRAGLERDGSRPRRNGLLLKAVAHTRFPLSSTQAQLRLPLELVLWQTKLEEARLYCGSPCHGSKLEADWGDASAICSTCSESWPAPETPLFALLAKRMKTLEERREGFAPAAEKTVEEWLGFYTPLSVLERQLEAVGLVAHSIRLLTALPLLLPEPRTLRFVDSGDGLVYPAQQVLTEESLQALSKALEQALAQTA